MRPVTLALLALLPAACAAPEDTVTFTRIIDGAIVTDRASTGGVSWIDYDEDGDLDLYVTNGFDVSMEAAPAQANRLYRNDRGAFIPISDHALVQDSGYSSGSTWGDYDGDGDLDLLVGNWPNNPGPEEENFLYRNDGPVGNWIRLHLVGTPSNRAAIGARVVVTAGGHTQTREITAHTGWRSQNPLELLVGLGTAEIADEIVVHWPSGATDTHSDLAAGQAHTLTEGGR
jgi:hypothetical protein